MSNFFDDIYPYRAKIDEQRYSLAIEEALKLLEEFRNSTPTQYAKEHKGSPFYVMGYAAFASHDYSAASLYFDSAVAEDRKNYPSQTDKPSLHFMRLKDEGQEVLASQVIREIISIAEELLEDHNKRSNSQNITLDELRTFFFDPIIVSPKEHKRALITTFISFVAEWKYRSRLIGLIKNGSREPFFLHLFRGCLLFESLLKEQNTKPLTKNTLGAILEKDVKTELNLSKIDVKATDFDTIVSGLAPLMDMRDTVNCVGKVRNTLGHNIAWPTTNLSADAYDMLVKNIAATCLHVISNLYR